MKRRRLLFYTHALVGGGAERVFARLASGFAQRGDEVTFAVDFEAQENLSFLAKDVRLVVLPRGHAAATWSLAQILRSEQPHASLSAISVSNLKHAAASVLAGRRKQAILTYHGFYESEPERLSNIGYRLTRLLSQVVGATVAVSHCLRDDLIARFSVAPERVTTIYNPAAPEPIPPALSQNDFARRAPIVLSMGRLVADKDYVTLLRAFALVRYPEARLVILGEGPERARLEAEARALGVEDRVSLPGFRTEISAELDRARCFVVSSRRETFNLSCIEAIAHSLPIIVTDCGGPTEIVNTPSVGAIVSVGDAPAIAQWIDVFLTAPGDPTARWRRASAFSLDTALDAYDALICSVASR